jgi:hypothetical protein
VGRRVGGIAVALLALGAGFVPVPVAGASPAAWKVVATPDLGRPTQLLGISCPDATTCFAVGSVDRFGAPHSVIERWDGRTWKRVANPHLEGDELLAVSCADANHCVAVGERTDDLPESSLIEVWDGATWTIEPGPHPALYENWLTSVSCASATRCAAVGFGLGFHSAATPIVATYDGSTWTGGAGPTDAGEQALLHGVSCSRVDRCIGVGERGSEAGVEREYVVAWNGREWSQQSTNLPDVRPRVLLGVTCRRAHACVAIGQRGHRPLVEVGEAASWSIAARPDPGIASQFDGIACPRATRCVAVGAQGPWSRLHDRPLVETARESIWTEVPAASVGGDDALRAVACASVDVCFAVGTTKTNGVASPLVLTGQP